ncbi:excinuclease ABC subunit UvrA [Sulfuriroseicoccus oceanibius]|uniref:UvrABC system protein A n=1 Tax=Sulfuriroseicoccus oceanibius TaxID=2707525 RepID=A0A6B3L364_9BACT|nr:excinuclease ABC subunit UvrA [Sulfuriroseicoccus oceanibius]QQL45530.1 excinuclease ABC subunit UvrA [Sulfuriroseicoccus oceanibius]
MPRKKQPTKQRVIRVTGARQNNLNGIDLEIPVGKLTVVTGPSGSGKSSLAFQTLYAEGQRRYVETFSPYIRQFFDRMDKPQVDRIDGIPPAIAIEQTNNVRTSRSTVGTITEINDYLKILFARLAKGYCPQTGLEVVPATAQSILSFALNEWEDRALLVTFPVPAPTDKEPAEFFEFLHQQGVLRVVIFGEVLRTDEPESYSKKRLPAEVLVVQDRIRSKDDQRTRLLEAIEAALHSGKGEAVLIDSKSGDQQRFTADWLCPESGIRLHPPTPGLFSFNSPVGACPKCRGFGKVIALDIHRAIPDPTLSIREGAVKAFQGETYSECQRDLIRCAKTRGLDLDVPFEDLDEDDQDWVRDGDPGYADPDDAWANQAWYGVRGFFDWLESKSYKMHVRVFLSRFRDYTECPACRGARLQPDALNFRIADLTLPEVWTTPVNLLLPFFRNEVAPLLPKDDPATRLVYENVESRLNYLTKVGLTYLTLDRETRTLSGGETARVNLTTCLGAALTGTLFVLDEPSVGLHPRDTSRLIEVMHRLRDQGNTIVVVEHEESVMRAADHLVDIGPGRGKDGGDLVFSGPLAKLSPATTPKSLTAQYLGGTAEIAIPAQRRRPTLKNWLRVNGASGHNLKKLNVDIPLGVFCAVSGVSGSGKSTLVHHILHPHIAAALGKATASGTSQGRIRSLAGTENLSDVVMVDQTPIARTPRSTPVVYLGVFDAIRKLFANTPQARAQDLKPGYFSFNTSGGRCERCGGMGWEKIEMQFLSDLFVVCPECEGKRYHSAALEFTLGSKTIAETLELTTDEARDFFAGRAGHKKPNRDLQRILDALDLMRELGLGYLRIGQPVNTLSGGEAQRLKLISHLLESPSGKSTRKTLFIFDEPTTGLHFDDIRLLLAAFQRMVDSGHSLLVIEHNLDVLKCADHVIDLGPDAGADGGLVVATGTPEEVAERDTHTGRFLAELLTDGRSLAAESEAHYNAAPPETNTISIHGAREHNLKNINLDIPRDEFVVITGLSGSGKSTIAFDIVFAEGQRRFLDSMSPYARQFAEQMEKPDVDHIDGLPPTVAIEQRISRGGGKSTVGTVTEVYHFLRLLFAKVGIQHCPESGVPVVSQSESAISSQLHELAKSASLKVLAPVIRNRKGFHTDVAEAAGRKGFTHLLVDGKITAIDGFQPLERFKTHDIDIVIGEVPKGGLSVTAMDELIATALLHGKGTLRVLAGRSKSLQVFSTRAVSPVTGESFDDLEPNTFSFNSPRGWCPECRGFGFVHSFAKPTGREESVLEEELNEERRLENAAESELVACPQCGGSRLHRNARAVRLPESGGHPWSLPELVTRDVASLKADISSLTFSGREKLIARDILPEITQRLHFMESVGLGYLSLDRAATTLSGGESQRIRLAAQLGSNLRGVLYVLDEPTIGLHPKDNKHLLDTLEQLRTQGNSLLVVEHDEETMQRASHIIDLGPGAGRLGGEVVASGSLAQIKRKTRISATARHMKAPMQHPIHGTRRKLPAKSAKQGWLKINGAHLRNLQDLNVQIPEKRLTVITGVSGSGKSTLMRGVVHPVAQALAGKKKTTKKPDFSDLCKSATGFDQLTAVYEVDQSPIGKTSRSTPSTYVKVFDDIRKLFANVPDARLRGYTASRFSFNTEGGRCEACKGNGRVKLEMNFLPTTWVPCDECNGQRYNSATLEVLYNGKSIGDVMAMTIEEAAAFFDAHPKIRRTLELLTDTGLGYLQLGQPSPTLSGGEAQRIKLVAQLIRGVGRSANAKLKLREAPGCLYLIEEPTIGLHMEDVAKLIDVLHRLVDDGHTVMVIEHNVDVMAEADYLIDIGPDAGPNGGTITAAGTPEQVAAKKTSHTAPFIAAALK